ncbi:MAG: hypothetical protein A2669_01995 [Candidatus Yanofskybacteria bacterium RIFCSPHIGHO2_01_FULL_48_25b]|uniref:Uncharacterized protein n=1 Tax=Candidatus Yanofskybacteria bacterium RIFCSPHIGHO2_01_FULL_48_25b TaxID=1802672 RepID=A0A1F8F470_9BACT|nr:MAG: hypothetical protein A2669_01995 [Candidatus Yanofskybacteria bacterium RIFCSPHIGHO2_01_FULL_48_25b]
MRRITVLIFVASLLGSVSAVSAQSFVGTEVKISESNKPVALIDGWFEATRKVGPEPANSEVDRRQALGAFIWAFSTPGFSEVYAGPVWYPTPNIELSFGVGIENADKPLRMGTAFLYLGAEYTVFSAYENGGSGYWYKVTVTKKVAGRWSAGFHSRRFSPTGPLFEYRPNGRYTIWTAFGPDIEPRERPLKLVVGLNVGLP